MMTQHTFHIHLKGRVQGVGFRPFVYRLALQHGLKGQVLNAPDGVHIEFNAAPEQARRFLEQVTRQAPRLSHISGQSLKELPTKFFDTFAIVSSDTAAEADMLLAPDFALCADCRRELQAVGDVRHGYAFITCTLCGPRFSIVESLPYDRPLTAMRDFAMCPHCAAEYENPLDRRYFSQTNSCPDCGVQLFFEKNGSGETIFHQALALEKTLEMLRSGQTVAVKGIGGYLLLCDATDAAAIQNLRQRKHRPAKPFAVLYPSLELLRGDALVRPEEEALLNGPVSPIVLLRLLPSPASGLATDLIAPGLKHIGALLPYAPLLEQIAGAFGKPLIATSGNHGGSPIVFDNEVARRELSGVSDALLGHNRRIVTPQDDSVVRLSDRHRQHIVVRRARGLAPSLLLPGWKTAHAETVFCAGADLKSAFGWARGGNIYLSPYLGDLGHFDTQENYRRMALQFANMLGKTPTLVVADRHPDYASTRMAAVLAEQWQAKYLQVQHHEAHFAAVLAENELLETKKPVLGIIWDGTGYGTDNQVWGGEFFLWHDGEMSRTAHWADFPAPAGDKMAREPRLAALAIAGDLEGAESLLRPKFSAQEWDFYQKLLKNGTPLRSTSAGRIFDALASLLNLADRNTYEGEAAMLLENVAAGADFGPAIPLKGPYFANHQTIDTRLFFQDVIHAKHQKQTPRNIAAGIHLALVQIIDNVAKSRQVQDIAFSGGVFQNALLVDLLIEHLSPEYRLHFHRQLSPNDECIALGQMVLGTANYQPLLTTNNQ